MRRPTTCWRSVPTWRRGSPVGVTPRLSDAELVTLATMQAILGHKNYFGRGFERELPECGVQLLRPARTGERERPGAALFKPLRQVIESINETFKGQLDSII